MLSPDSKDNQQDPGLREQGQNQRLSGVIIPPTQCFLDDIQNTESSVGSPNTRQTEKLDGVPGRSLGWWGLEHMACKESLGELGLFSLEQRWLWGVLTAPHHLYKEVIEEMEPGSSQWCMVGG